MSINVVFNVDSTLVTIEGPSEIARRRKIVGIDELTEQAMRGDQSFARVFRQRFELYRPTLRDLEWLADQYVNKVVPDAAEVIRRIQEQDHQVFIVSASYRLSILKLAKLLRIPAHHVCAIDAEFDQDGRYINCDMDNILTTDEGVRIVLAEIAKSGPTIYIGDSVRDLDAKAVVDLFIGFGGVKVRPLVKQKAEIFIEELSLGPILNHVEQLSHQYDLKAKLNQSHNLLS